MSGGKIKLLGVESPRFSGDQISIILEEAKSLQEFVELHEISCDSVDIDKARERSNLSPTRVYSLLPDPEFRDGYQGRYFLFQGFLDDDVDDYFLGDKDLKSDLTYPCTILDLDCVNCDGTGEDGEEECANCEYGELSVDLFWDQTWTVTVEYSGE